MISNDIVATMRAVDTQIFLSFSDTGEKKKTCSNIGNSCHPQSKAFVHMKRVANRMICQHNTYPVREFTPEVPGKSEGRKTAD